MMGWVAKNKVRLLVTALVLVIFAVYFVVNIDKFRPLRDIEGWLLILIGLGDISIIMANGLFTKFILRPFGKSISLAESFYVSLISSVGNFFAPAGAGFAFRAVYLKRKHGLPYSDYVSVLFGNYIIVFLINSTFGLFSLWLLRSRANHQYAIITFVLATIFIVSLLLTIIKVPGLETVQTKNRAAAYLLNVFHKISIGWRKIVAHPKLLLQLSAVTVLNLALTIFITWMIILSLNLHVGFAALVLFSVLGSLSLFVNITPANLGVKEAIYLFSSTVLGFSIWQILLIALIDRGVQFIVLLLLWLSSSKMRRQSSF